MKWNCGVECDGIIQEFPNIHCCTCTVEFVWGQIVLFRIFLLPGLGLKYPPQRHQRRDSSDQTLYYSILCLIYNTCYEYQQICKHRGCPSVAYRRLGVFPRMGQEPLRQGHSPMYIVLYSVIWECSLLPQKGTFVSEGLFPRKTTTVTHKDTGGYPRSPSIKRFQTHFSHGQNCPRNRRRTRSSRAA